MCRDSRCLTLGTLKFLVQEEKGKKMLHRRGQDRARVLGCLSESLWSPQKGTVTLVPEHTGNLSLRMFPSEL